VVIVAGHYDTARLKGIAFVGANDGGSSAAEPLELARVLSRHRHLLTYWVVFFDGEEALEQWSQTDSLYGSGHLAEELATNGRLAEVRALILVDMVAGRELISSQSRIPPRGCATSWLRTPGNWAMRVPSTDGNFRLRTTQKIKQMPECASIP